MINQGGTERILSIKANYLVEHYAYEIVVVTSCQNGQPFSFHLSPRIRHIDIGIDFYHHHLRKAFASALEQCIRKEKPDICVSFSNDDLPIMAKIKDGSIKVAEYHFPYQRYLLEGKGWISAPRSWLKIHKIRRAAARMDAFVVLTQADWQKWHLPNCLVIGNPSHLPFQGKTASFDSKHFLAFGRMEKEKNFQELIEIWEIVSREKRDYYLDIYGEGSLKSELQLLIEEKGLQEQIKLHPPTPDVAGKMVEGCGILMTSIFEGFPMVLVESLPFGLPLIAYDCPNGPAEIIQDGTNGYLIQPGNKQAFARRIIELTQEPERWNILRQGCLEIAPNFSLEHIMSQWDLLFNRLYEKRKTDS